MSCWARWQRRREEDGLRWSKQEAATSLPEGRQHFEGLHLEVWQSFGLSLMASPSLDEWKVKMQWRNPDPTHTLRLDVTPHPRLLLQTGLHSYAACFPRTFQRGAGCPQSKATDLSTTRITPATSRLSHRLCRCFYSIKRPRRNEDFPNFDVQLWKCEMRPEVRDHV